MRHRRLSRSLHEDLLLPGLDSGHPEGIEREKLELAKDNVGMSIRGVGTVVGILDEDRINIESAEEWMNQTYTFS